MPPENQVNKDFLRDVFADRKSLFLKSEIKYIDVPQYDELSVKNLWGGFKEDKAFMQYFPEKYPDGKGPARAFFFNVMNTLYPEYLD